MPQPPTLRAVLAWCYWTEETSGIHVERGTAVMTRAIYRARLWAWAAASGSGTAREVHHDWMHLRNMLVGAWDMGDVCMRPPMQPTAAPTEEE